MLILLICATDNKVNLYVNHTQLDKTSVLGIFTRSIANMSSGKEREGYERILLYSIIMCIAYLTSVFGRFTRSIV